MVIASFVKVLLVRWVLWTVVVTAFVLWVGSCFTPPKDRVISPGANPIFLSSDLQAPESTAISIPIKQGRTALDRVIDTLRRSEGKPFLFGMVTLWVLGLFGITIGGTFHRVRTHATTRAHQLLEESEEQLRVIFEASEAGIVLVNPGGYVRFANRRAAEIFGTTPGELINSSYSDHLHTSEMPEGLERIRQITTGEVQSVALERRYLRKDGSDFWGHLTGRRLEHPDGSLRALVGVITDISDRKQAEIERNNLQAKLQQAQKMESLGLLAGGIAHDMNNVLGAILGWSSASIEEHAEGSPTFRAFDTISKAAIRGGKMVNGLLRFSRQGPGELAAINLNEIVREEVRLLERTTLSKIRLILDLACDLKPIMGDANAITHAIMNLCVNAVDSMPESGTLTLRTLSSDPEWVEIQVADSGCGMTEDVLRRAMDPFFTTKDAGRGTGLGLSMVYSTVKDHDGELFIQSEPGLGTCVQMRFPVGESMPAAAEPLKNKSSSSIPSDLHIMVVDDDELFLSSVGVMLRQLGHQETLISSGEDALATLEIGFQPDLVILNVNMPGLGGAATLTLLRLMRPMVPILLVTGWVDQGVLELARAYSRVTLLPKPFGIRDLQLMLESTKTQ